MWERLDKHKNVVPNEPESLPCRSLKTLYTPYFVYLKNFCSVSNTKVSLNHTKYGFWGNCLY